ncbi:MAG: hypothetical protein LBL82_05390 [Oscillospiraceae bacterium]|nr:hypothetical protein [Oscillospiraceae bacterium]
MSIFGLISIFVFLLSVGGAVILYYTDSERVGLSRFLMLILYLLLFSYIILSTMEYPLMIVDGILFVSMGMELMAKIMLGVAGMILFFFVLMILRKIKWKKFLRVTPVKLVVVGFLIITGMAYTELMNGMFSFEYKDDFYRIKEAYSQYDRHFFPTKYIENDADEEGEQKTVSVYPFDAETPSGKLPMAYKIKIFVAFDSDTGTNRVYHYPFTYKTYVKGTPIPIDEANLIIVDPVSGSDLSGSDAVTPTDGETGDS